MYVRSESNESGALLLKICKLPVLLVIIRLNHKFIILLPSFIALAENVTFFQSCCGCTYLVAEGLSFRDEQIFFSTHDNFKMLSRDLWNKGHTSQNMLNK